ncbi:hypothetical protein D3C80_2149360 [compost metagenome]
MLAWLGQMLKTHRPIETADRISSAGRLIRIAPRSFHLAIYLGRNMKNRKKMMSTKINK